MTLKDDKDPSLGFWLAWLDNSKNFLVEIKVFDFNAKFIAELAKLSKKVEE